MINFRIVKICFISITFFSNTSYCQETFIGSEKNIPDKKSDFSSKRQFYKVSKSNRTKIFKKAVTEHIVKNQGIQDFYNISNLETEWLDTILKSEKLWHEQLLQLESDYRNAFQNRVEIKSGQSDIGFRIKNYKKNISKIEKDIDEIRRQIVQINVDQQVYINSLSKTPITTLVAIETVYNSNLIKIKDKLNDLNKSIFKSLEDPVLANITRNYKKIIKIPFKSGHVKISYMYPENITRFDDKANELVYLFLRVEGFPFSKSNLTNIVGNNRDIKVQIFSDVEQIKSYLNAKKVGDNRLFNWLKKEFLYQKINNKHLLDNIKARLNDFDMFRNGLNSNISLLNSKVKNIEAEKNHVMKKETIQSIESEYERTKDLYQSFFSKRQILSNEKYTLENDVMYSLFSIEGDPKVRNKDLNKKIIFNNNSVTNIPMSGRPIKDIFSDILLTAHKNRNFNLQNYRERIYRPNEENSQLIQGELEWEIENEEFSILKLTKGNVGSRSHFVVHLAKLTNLKSKPGFPAEKSGVCKASLLFKRGKDIMRDSQKPILNRLVKCLRKFPQQMVEITGHTDPLKPNYGEGSKYSNVILGLKRAEKMVNTLTKLKFNPGRFIVVSRGAQMPVAIGKSNKQLQKNRRVEIISKPGFK